MDSEYRQKCQLQVYNKHKEKLIDQIKLYPFKYHYDVIVDDGITYVGHCHLQDYHDVTDQLAKLFIKDGYQVEVIYNYRHFVSVSDILRIKIN